MLWYSWNNTAMKIGQEKEKHYFEVTEYCYELTLKPWKTELEVTKKHDRRAWDKNSECWSRFLEDFQQQNKTQEELLSVVW